MGWSEQDDLVRYRSPVYDSERWARVPLRAGDIVVSTPPKCGTTWTQMICALLVLQTPTFDRPLSLISPWVDSLLRPLDDVVRDLEAQPHRRIIKTHTPLDGVPRVEGVTYLVVGRDPRDVAVSMDHHLSNMDMEAFLAAKAAAGGGSNDLPPTPLGGAPRPHSPIERFWRWVDDETEPTRSGSTLRRTLDHLGTFWPHRNDGDVVLLHYDDMRSDLAGTMRSLAERLGITVDDELLPVLVQAATFESMRADPSLVPNATNRIWKDDKAFFHRGTSGQWRELLDDHDLARYRRRAEAMADARLVDWIHRPPLR